jgi:hypothetical protein
MTPMKRTYNLDPDVVATVRREVEEARSAPSQDAFVAAAILNWARELREAREALRWAEAAIDPRFRADAVELEQGLAADERAAWGE